MVYTLYYNDKRQQTDRIDAAQYKLLIVRNPYEYVGDEDAITSTDWKYYGSKIRSSNLRICRGSISTGFFQDETVDNTSVIFLLYYISHPKDKRSGRTSSTLLGFSLLNDLRNDRDDSDIEKNTLYIDVICVNSDIVRNPPHGGLRGGGIFLMSQIEKYAKQELHDSVTGKLISREQPPFKVLKLSALPYVISFYRYLGFRHIHKKSDVLKNTMEKNKKIRELAIASSTLRFKTDVELEHAMKIELAKHHTLLTTTKDSQEEAEYFIRNANEYFSSNNIHFQLISIAPLKIAAIDVESSTINQDITRLIEVDNSPMLHLLNELRKKKLSVELADKETPPKGIRHVTFRDSEGDVAFHSLDEGFTMRKILDFPETASRKSSSASRKSSSASRKSSSASRKSSSASRKSSSASRKSSSASRKSSSASRKSSRSSRKTKKRFK